MAARQENVKWVDGIRGLASVTVVITHLCRAFDEDLFKPTSAEGVAPRVAQWPIARVFFQGRIGVAIFGLVTGYVCALKPIRQCRAGHPETAYASIAKSAFRRVPRLILPATLATTIIWFFCQFGIFEAGSHAENFWLNFSSPQMTPYFGDAIRSLLYNFITTWVNGQNVYDYNQWTLLPLLKGSMVVYMMLIATANARPKYRMMISLAFFVYYYISNDAELGMQFFFGVFLSELSQDTTHVTWCQSRKWLSRYLSPVLILIGLILASYPEDRAEWTAWSTVMGQTSVYIFPRDNDTPRFYTGIGLDFIALGIHFSPSAKNFFSHRLLLWFGKNSFAVYLIHGPLLRSILVWMYMGFTVPPDVENEKGEMEPGQLKLCGRARFWFWMPIWWCLVYGVANLWTKYVDPWCAKLTESLVKYVFEDAGDLETEKRILPQ